MNTFQLIISFLVSVVLGLLSNMVASYLQPTTTKGKRLIYSAFIALIVFAVVLLVLPNWRGSSAQARANIISNGDFSNGTAGWGNWPQNADGSFGVVDGVLCVDIKDGGPGFDSYAVSPYVVNVETKHTYNITFHARALDRRTIVFRAWDFDSRKEYFSKAVIVTPQSQPYTMSFDLDSPKNANVQFEFLVGGQGSGQVCMDSVIISQQ